MNSPNPKYTPLTGYVFLSEPEGKNVFLIERDGRIWQQHDQLVFRPERQDRPELFNWHGWLEGEASWRFPVPGVPVLELQRNGKTLRFLMEKEHLWLSDGGRACDITGKTSVSCAEFESKTASLIREWEKRLRWLDAIPVPECGDTAGLRDSMRISAMLQECAYTGLHPHYGAGFYGLAQHDGFPPATLAVVSTRLAAGD